MRWTPEIAYAVGLLATDGNLSKDGRHITLRSSDFVQLETFRRCLQITVTIKQTTLGPLSKQIPFRIQFSNAKLYRWLLTVGVFPAKTYTLSRINVPNKFFRDFLRGHLDGDGSIIIYNDKYNFYKGRNYTHYRVNLRFISVSIKHLFWLREMIGHLAGCAGAITFYQPKNKNHVPMWTLKFSKKEALQLFKWMYYSADVPCLDRKYQKAKQAMEYCSSEKRKPYTKVESDLLQ